MDWVGGGECVSTFPSPRPNVRPTIPGPSLLSHNRGQGSNRSHEGLHLRREAGDNVCPARPAPGHHGDLLQPLLRALPLQPQEELT